MPGNANAAAHHHPVGEGHCGFGVGGDQPVHEILGGKETVRLAGLAVEHQLPHRPHVAAGAETALAPPLEQHQTDAGVVAPLLEGADDAVDHLGAERVDRRGPV